MVTSNNDILSKEQTQLVRVKSKITSFFESFGFGDFELLKNYTEASRTVSVKTKKGSTQ